MPYDPDKNNFYSQGAGFTFVIVGALFVIFGMIELVKWIASLFH